MTTQITTRSDRVAGVGQAILLLAAACMPVMAATLITPVLPQLSAYFADTPGAGVLVPLIVSTPALMVAVCAPFAGEIVDRVGRKSLLIIALVAYALLGTSPLYLDGLSLILGSRLLLGMCESAIMTVSTALIVDYYREERVRNRYLGLQAAATAIGATAFILIGTVLGASGWRAPFWVYLVSIVIAVPMITMLWEPRSEQSDARADRVSIPWSRIGWPLLITVFGGFSFYLLIVEISYLVVETGIRADDTAAIGGVAAIASVFVALGGVLFPRVERRFGDHVVAVAFSLQAVGMIALWLLSSFGLPGLVVGALIASFGSGLLLPGFLIWVVARTAFAERGRVTGLWTAAFFLGQFLTPIIAAGLAATVGGLIPAVGIGGIAAAAVAGATLVLSRRRAVADR